MKPCKVCIRPDACDCLCRTCVAAKNMDRLERFKARLESCVSLAEKRRLERSIEELRKKGHEGAVERDKEQT